MRLLTCALTLVGTIGADSMLNKADAQIRRFPYRAVVEGDNVYVRSGPGRSYYPTSKLRNAARVTVHRHDPGGWYMIAPPAGSFSWIRADYVQNTSADQGVLTASNVIVRVGSTFGDSRDIEQVRLSKGARVAILGETTAHSQNGTVRWYKIASPRGEYRWVSGRHIVPLGASARRENDTDPYSIPSDAIRNGTNHRNASLKGNRTTGGPSISGPSLRGGNRSRSRSHSRDGETLSSDYSGHQQKLEQLDEQFRTMVQRKPRFWDFTDLESGYEGIRSHCSHAGMRRKVASRIAAIDHHRSVKDDYDDIIRLTADTSARESRLAKVQQRLAQRAQLGGAAPVTLADNDEPAQPPHQNNPTVTSYPQPARLPAPRSGRMPSHGAPTARQPVRLAPPVPNVGTPHRPQRRLPQPGQRVNAMRPRKFDGAGIIRRVVARAPGMPQHALVAPSGRILAYLQPVPGLPLDRYVGRPMGVYGQRSHRQDLRNDFIVVRAMMPVKLMP